MSEKTPLKVIFKASLVPPMQEILAPVDFLLKLEESIEQSLSGWRAPRDVNVDWHDSVTASNHRVGVVIVSTSIGTASH
jgi:hypothetical protein